MKDLPWPPAAREDRRTKRLRDEAAEEGVAFYSPFLDAGSDMVTLVGFEAMHAYANVFKAFRAAVMGHGMLQCAHPAAHLAYEWEVNKRFEAAAADPSAAQAKLPYTLKRGELVQVRARNATASESGLLHPAFKGSRVMNAFGEESTKGKLQYLKCADSHILLGPITKWMLAGMLEEEISIKGFSAPAQEIVFEFLDAMNQARRKEVTEEDQTIIVERLCVAVAKLQLLLPAFECNHTFHQVLEIVKELPVHLSSVWGQERYMRVVRAVAHNKNSVAATVARALQRSLGYFFRQQEGDGEDDFFSSDVELGQRAEPWDVQVVPPPSAPPPGEPPWFLHCPGGF